MQSMVALSPVLVLLLVAAAECLDTKCELQTKFGRRYSFSSPFGRMVLMDDRLVVGLTNYVATLQWNLDPADPALTDMRPSEDSREECKNSLALGRPEQCENFIRLLAPSPVSGEVLVCGTNAFSPKCWLYDPRSGGYRQLTEDSGMDIGYAPFTSDRANAGVMASTGQFFSATFFTPETFSIGMAPDPLGIRNQSDPQPQFLLRTPTNPLWVHTRPEVVSAYEIGDHAYFFAREPAYEVNKGQTVAYSRAIRVCMNDSGLEQSSGRTFRTFQKARMKCTKTSSGSDALPYDYNLLTATFLRRDENGEPTLYGAFSSAKNGPKGAAVCKFSFSEESSGSLKQVFQSSEYYVQESGKSSWTTATEPLFTCSEQRSDIHAVNHQLLYSPVTAEQPEPLVTWQGAGFTDLAVDVVRYSDGRQYEVMFLAVDEGELWQVIVGQGQVLQKELLTTCTGDGIVNLILTVDREREVRRLYAATKSEVMLLEFGVCSKHSTCYDCLQLHDTYCTWNKDSCTNKLQYPELNAAFLNGNASSTCPGPDSSTETPTDGPETTSSGRPTTSSSGSASIPSASVPSTGGVLGSSGEGQLNVAAIVGAAVGGLVLGALIGSGVCVLVYLFRTHFNSDAEDQESVPVRQVNNDFRAPSNAGTNGHVQEKCDLSVKLKMSQQEQRGGSGVVGEYDDVVMELPAASTPTFLPVSRYVQHKPVRTRGRTESTKAMLRASESDIESPQSPQPV